jgi:hypothetical protein
VWFAELIWKARAGLDKILPADPTLRIGVAFVSGWTFWSVVLYTSRTLDNRTGHYVNHAHGHVLDAVLTALALTVCCSILLVIMFAARSDDS